MMNTFIKYICASFLILMSGMMSAQNPECVTVDVDYSVDVSATAELKGQAIVVFQGNSFRMSGNGIESYCDGSSVWTLDLEAKEVYIEAVTADSEAYMKELAPKLASMKPGAETSFTAPEGQTVRIKVNSIKKSDGTDISSFRPTYKFDSSWVVTDLR